MKLKEKIKNWLLKDELDKLNEFKLKTEEEVKEIKETYDECLHQINRAHKMLLEEINQHNKSYILLEDCRKFMNSVCDVGTDVGFKSNDHSWAVICVHGKMDYVKFVDMNHHDIMEIASFLKRFEYSNRVTDSPLNKLIIEDMIIKL